MSLTKLIFSGILDLTIEFYLFHFYEWYWKYNIVTRDSLPLWIVSWCRISINFSQNFFVTLGCFSGCKLYCVTLGCVHHSSWSLPFVWRERTRTGHAENLLKFCLENLVPAEDSALLLWAASDPHQLHFFTFWGFSIHVKAFDTMFSKSCFLKRTNKLIYEQAVSDGDLLKVTTEVNSSPRRFSDWFNIMYSKLEF